MTTIVDVINTALNPFGVKPFLVGKKFLRFPAVWRSSREFNLSLNIESGICRDWVTHEDYTFNQLLEFLDIDINDIENLKIIKSNGSKSLKAVKNQHFAKSDYERSPSLYQMHSPAAKVCLKYLKNRGINPDLLDSKILNLLKAKKDENGVTFLFPIFSPEDNGKLIGIQRIFLDQHGHKLDIDNNKKMLGEHIHEKGSGGFLIYGDSKRFNKKMIALCEGPETGLAIREATGMPVYVLYDVGGLKSVSLEYLSLLGVDSILIASDNDDKKVGQNAAKDLAERICLETETPVRISIPPREYGGHKGSDWLDVYEKNPAGTAKLIFNSLEYVPENKRGKTGRDVVINSVFKKKQPHIF